MKRSEMLEFIASYFDDCLEITDHSESMDHAEELLSGLEEVGMLPPDRCKIEVHESWKYQGDFDLKGNEIPIVGKILNVNTWEPEL